MATIRSVRNVDFESSASGLPPGGDGQEEHAQHRADEHHRAEHVQEERQEWAAGGDHCARLPDHVDQQEQRREPGQPRHRVAAPVVQEGAQLVVGRVACRSELLGDGPCLFLVLAAGAAERAHHDPQDEGGDDPEAEQLDRALLVHEPEPEDERRDRADADQRQGRANHAQHEGRVARPFRAHGERVEDSGRNGTSDQQERARDVQHQEPVERAHGWEHTLSGGWKHATGI